MKIVRQTAWWILNIGKLSVRVVAVLAVFFGEVLLKVFEGLEDWTDEPPTLVRPYQTDRLNRYITNWYAHHPDPDYFKSYQYEPDPKLKPEPGSGPVYTTKPKSVSVVGAAVGNTIGGAAGILGSAGAVVGKALGNGFTPFPSSFKPSPGSAEELIHLKVVENRIYGALQEKASHPHFTSKIVNFIVKSHTHITDGVYSMVFVMINNHGFTFDVEIQYNAAKTTQHRVYNLFRDRISALNQDIIDGKLVGTSRKTPREWWTSPRLGELKMQGVV